MKWVLAEKFPEEFQKSFPEFDSAVLQLLWNRNLKTQEQIDEFFNPDYGGDIHDPFLLADMEKAVTRIFKAVKQSEKIVVYGDYDADGVCAAVILISILKSLGAMCEVYIPHRDKEGYGLNCGAVEYLIKNEAKIIITCDCGIGNSGEIDLAVKSGCDVIVTDHHSLPLELPKSAFALIHPQLSKDYPFKELSGAGVAFKLAQALLKKNAAENMEATEKWLLDLVAIANVADIVPLLAENRTLTKYGMIVLNKTRRLGLQKLIAAASLELGKIDTWSVSFQISPRINAAGRMDHANAAFQMLLTKSEAEAQELAAQLNRNNTERQKQSDLVFEEAKYQIIKAGKEKDFCLFGFSPDWSMSLVGLVAGKISEEFYRPVLLFTESGEKIKGSGRSIDEWSLIGGLKKVDEFLERYGGHDAAAGCVLKDAQKFEIFKEALLKIAAEDLRDKELTPAIGIDAEIDIQNADWQFYEVLSKFEPFGEGNPRPKFLAKGLKVVEMQSVGKNGNHLRLGVQGEEGPVKKMIGFCFGQWCQNIKIGDRVDVVFEIGINTWNGNCELQFKIVDLQLKSS